MVVFWSLMKVSSAREAQHTLVLISISATDESHGQECYIFWKEPEGGGFYLCSLPLETVRVFGRLAFTCTGGLIWLWSDFRRACWLLRQVLAAKL